MLKQYRLKVTQTVDAEKVTPENYQRIAEWCKGVILSHWGTVEGIMVPTLGGAVPAYIDREYVVKDGLAFRVMGISYFEDKYELVP